MPEFEFLTNGTLRGAPTCLLAHGSGIGMTSPFMTTVAEGLAEQGINVVRFEFAYMAQRRTGGAKRPPPKVELLQAEYHAALAALMAEQDITGPLVIGGKSLGGRVASLIAEDLYAAGKISGVLCLGYPFHPQGKPEVLRTAHLQDMKTPALICQGTRDPFGTSIEVAGYALSDQITLTWFEDGDHDLKPRVRVSGLDHATHLATCCESAAKWIKQRDRLPL
jgi:predicted alpha/beta-hydrolase family hydrolase